MSQTTTNPAIDTAIAGQLVADRHAEIESIDHAHAAEIQPGETLVISGFWRSGTTWLQECLSEILQAKTVFEPFHFRVPSTKELFKYYGFAKKSQSVREMFVPFCGEESLDNQPFLYRYFDQTLRADLPGHIVRVLRRGQAESYRQQVVVKFTRGQFSLPAAQKSFSMPVIHIYRDPRAVVASAKMTDWYWMFDELSLREQLLEVKDGRAKYFRQFEDAIAAFDRDKVSRIAAYWAFTEKFIRDAFVRENARVVLESYENLGRQREPLMKKMLLQLGMKKVWSDDIDIAGRDSFSTSQQRQGASAEERISGWKKVLSAEEIRAIEKIMQRLGMEDRLVESSVQ